MTGKKDNSCLRRELMTFDLTNCNFFASLKVWKTPEDRKKDEKFLAFVTDIKWELSELKKEKKTVLLSDAKPEEYKHSWGRKNPHGDKIMT